MNASLYVFAVENDQLIGLRAGQAKTFRVEQDGIAAVLLALLAAHRGRARLADASGGPNRPKARAREGRARGKEAKCG